MKRIHPPGKCNKTVSAKLKRHTATSVEDSETEDPSMDLPEDIDESGGSDQSDPRWDKLKDINFE